MRVILLMADCVRKKPQRALYQILSEIIYIAPARARQGKKTGRKITGLMGQKMV
jgi:hypothetical protein